MTILTRDPSGGWREPTGMGYESESTLQEILYSHPSLVPGVSSDAGQAIACREFQSAVGPADVVVLDSEGALTIVECKLANNQQIRREIVGQVLDYASRLWRMPVSEFERIWMRAESSAESPFEALGDDEGRARAALQENLDNGRMNLVLAVDRVNEPLKRIVEYLNAVTLPSTGVIVVEFTRVKERDVEILIPKAYGTELVEAKSASGKDRRPRWTLEQFFQWCNENDPEGAPLMELLVDSLHKNNFEIFGGRAATPSLNCGIMVPQIGRKFPIGVYTDLTRGALIEVRFTDFAKTPDRQIRLAEEVENIPSIPIPVESVRNTGFAKRPNIPAKQFTANMIPQLVAAVSRALS